MSTVNTDTLGSVSDVRYELGDTDEDIDMGLISYHLGRAREWVAEAVQSGLGASTDQLKAAVTLEAAWRVVSADRDAFVESKSAADVSKDTDVEAWISALKERRDSAINDISGTDAPRLRTFGGRATRT